MEHGVILMKILKKILLLAALMMAPAAAHAQDANPGAEATGAAPAVSGEATDASKAADGSLPGYTPMAPTQGIGMPKPGEIDLPEQFTENGQYAYGINNFLLLPIITIITIFVLGLLFWIIIRYRRKANPEPSKTTHNTAIEIVWTLVPVLILLVIAYPSLDLLARQFKPAPANAVTVKATGYQWYWTYSYPDHGGFEVISNMLKEPEDVGEGERARTDADGPALLAVDNRMVVPVGVPIRLQTTAEDVIHAFAVPALWFKLDAVPGRLNEKTLTITKPGVYYGQCSELCGARHGFMPIAVEALPPEKFAAWVRAQGGTMPGKEDAPPAEAPAATNDNATPADTAAATQ